MCGTHANATSTRRLANDLKAEQTTSRHILCRALQVAALPEHLIDFGAVPKQEEFLATGVGLG